MCTTGSDYSPDNHLCHLVSGTKLLVVDSDDGYDPGNVGHKVLVGGVQAGEVVQRDGGLALALTHLNPPLALLWSHVEMDDQVRLLPEGENQGHLASLIQPSGKNGALT